MREIEETKTEKEGLRQQLMATQEALTASQQRETEIQTLLREKIEDSDSQKHVFESRESESQQRLQVLETQTVQLQEELQAAQRNCASAIHEREAIHEENKKLTSVRVTLEGRLHGLREEATAREREWEQKLKQKEDEIRELQAVRVELSSRQEAEERLRAERNELQQRLGNVEHQLALCQVVPVEEQMSRIQKLTSREAQLSAELREQAATCQALGERVRVAQDSLNQTAQVRACTYIAHVCTCTGTLLYVRTCTCTMYVTVSQGTFAYIVRVYVHVMLFSMTCACKHTCTLYMYM